MRRILLLLALFATSILAAPDAHALACTWNGMGDGSSWGDAANWSCGEVPDADDDVTVNSGTITLGSPRTAASLTQTGGTLQNGDLGIAGSFTWTAGTQSGSGTTLVTGPTSFSGSGTKTLGAGRTVVLGAGGTWSNGSISMQDASVLRLPAGETLTVSAGNRAIQRSGTISTEPVFEIEGTLVRTGNPSVTFIRVNAEVSGTVAVDEGILAVERNSINEGLMTVADGAELEFRGSFSHTNAESGTVAGDGTVEVASNTTYLNEGAYAPGLMGPGTLTYDGDFALDSTAVLAAEISGETPGEDYDQLAVTGTADLGGTLRLSVVVGGDAFSIGDTFTVLTATDGVSGTFETVEPPFGYTVDVSYTANDVVVEVLTVPNFDLVAINTDPTGDPIEVTRPGSIRFAYAVTNNNPTDISGDVFYTAETGGTLIAQGRIISGTVPANSSSPALTYTQPVPNFAPTGTYTYSIKIGQFPDVVIDQVDFTVEVTTGARVAGGPALAAGSLDGAESDSSAVPDAEWQAAWAALDATPWISENGTVLMSVDGQTAAAPESLEAALTAVPETFGLAAAYPNPFESQTTLRLDVPEAAHVTVTVYDALGRRVAVLLDEEVEAQTHRVVFDASALGSGVYLVRAAGAGATAVQRVTLVR